MNDTAYGLTAGVYTPDAERAQAILARSRPARRTGTAATASARACPGRASATPASVSRCRPTASRRSRGPRRGTCGLYSRPLSPRLPARGGAHSRSRCSGDHGAESPCDCVNDRDITADCRGIRPAADRARGPGRQARKRDELARGKYLIVIGACNDCHTPGYAMSNGKVPEKDWLDRRPPGLARALGHDLRGQPTPVHAAP